MGAARLVVGNICRLGVLPEKLKGKHLIAEIGRHCTELLDHHGNGITSRTDQLFKKRIRLKEKQVVRKQ